MNGRTFFSGLSQPTFDGNHRKITTCKPLTDMVDDRWSDVVAGHSVGSYTEEHLRRSTDRGWSFGDAGMNQSLLDALPHLLPKSVAWAKERSAEIARDGVPLNPYGLSIARTIGVSDPEKIRVALVDRLPFPSDPELQQAALSTGLLRPNGAGLTLGHGIYAVRGQVTLQLLSHECRHVFQYERAGSMDAFLSDYLRQIAEHGYTNAPLEVDARKHELPEGSGAQP